MIVRANKVTALLIFISLGFFSPSIRIFAQDTVPQGVIKVRRAPIPSDYRVTLQYAYGTDRQGYLPHLFRRNEKTAMIYPPDPVSLDPNRNDSNQTLLDSSFIITFYNKEGRAEQEFDWTAWLDQYEHVFDWDDTAGIDSTVFVYTINSRGKVTCRGLAMDRKDTSAKRLQDHILPYMQKLWVWYPATRVRDDGKVLKKTNCVVTVKVYAIKEGYGQNLPLKIVD